MIGLAPTAGFAAVFVICTGYHYFFIQDEDVLYYDDFTAHFISFLLLAIVLFIPWMFAFGGIGDEILTNEQKFEKSTECHSEDKNMDYGETVGNSDVCKVSLLSLFLFFGSGIFMYLWCYGSAVAIYGVKGKLE